MRESFYDRIQSNSDVTTRKLACHYKTLQSPSMRFTNLQLKTGHQIDSGARSTGFSARNADTVDNTLNVRTVIRYKRDPHVTWPGSPSFSI